VTILDPRRFFGQEGEAEAERYLRRKGYRIIAMRYRNHYGEIDMLAVRGNVLVAVEVKARRSMAECAIAIAPQKQIKIMRAMTAQTTNGHSDQKVHH